MKRTKLPVAMLLATMLCGRAMQASACSLVFSQPTGFRVGYDRAGERQRLPANARGALYTDLRDGVPHPPSPDDFTVTDLTTRRRLEAKVDALTGPERQGSYLVYPVGGFAVGHEYAFETSTPPAVNSTFAPAIRVTIGPPISPDELARDARIATHKNAAQGKTLDIVGVALSGKAAAYAFGVESRVTSPRKGWPEGIIGPCGRGPDLMLSTPSGCHVVTADLRFPQLTDAPMKVSGLACMGWFTVPLPPP